MESTPAHLVFLHGWGGSRESLRGIGTLFQHAFRVHLIDLPGFGDAPPPPPDWDTIHYTDLVQAVSVCARLPGRSCSSAIRSAAAWRCGSRPGACRRSPASC